MSSRGQIIIPAIHPHIVSQGSEWGITVEEIPWKTCLSVTGNLPLVRSKKKFVRGDLHKEGKRLGEVKGEV